MPSSCTIAAVRYKNDVWELAVDQDSATWTLLAACDITIEPCPTPRAYHAAAVVDKALYIYGVR